MKKTINGKIYNTATATKVGYFDNNRDGFDHMEETLYMKRSGEYFLHGEGGARTEYGKYEDGSYSWGEEIIPMSSKAARMWCHESLSAEECEKMFGMESEIFCTLERQLISYIRIAGEEIGISIVSIESDEYSEDYITTCKLSDEALANVYDMAKENRTSIAKTIRGIINNAYNELY